MLLGTLQGSADTTLRPYEYRQLDRVFAKVTPGQVPDGYAIVRTTTEAGAFLTFASVIDNRTGDPVCILPASLESGPIWIPTAAHQAGSAGTNWRTDLELRNPHATQAAYRVELLKRGSDNSSPDAVSFTLGPGLAVRYTDILEEVFHFTGAAALRVVPTSGSLLAVSRTYNQMLVDTPQGLPKGSTFGQLVPAFGDDEGVAFGGAARLIMLGQDASYRTNLGYVNATGSSGLHCPPVNGGREA